ncbi:hypothetical protein SRHO_G00053650 [Serrasalmus rhombeus]
MSVKLPTVSPFIFNGTKIPRCSAAVRNMMELPGRRRRGRPQRRFMDVVKVDMEMKQIRCSSSALLPGRQMALCGPASLPHRVPAAAAGRAPEGGESSAWTRAAPFAGSPGEPMRVSRKQDQELQA